MDYHVTIYVTENRCYIYDGLSNVAVDTIRRTSYPLVGFVHPSHLDHVRRMQEGWQELIHYEAERGLCLVLGNPGKKKIEVTMPLVKVMERQIKGVPARTSKKTLFSIIAQVVKP